MFDSDRKGKGKKKGKRVTLPNSREGIPSKLPTPRGGKGTNSF